MGYPGAHGQRTVDRRTVLKYGASAAAALAATRLTGRASAQQAAGDEDSPAAKLEVKNEVEIQYWQYQYDTKVKLVNELIPEFEKANPKIKIKHVNFPYDDFLTKVMAAIQGGQGPDVLNLFYGMVPAYYQAQLLVALPSEAFPADYISEQFFPMVKGVSFDDKYYALPTAVRTLALYYNKDMLQAAGKQPPTTWEELVDVAQATTKHNGGKLEQAGFTWDIEGQGHSYWRSCLTRQNGLTPISDDNKKIFWTDDLAVEAFSWMADLNRKYHTGEKGFYTDGPTAFTQGHAALHVDGNYRLGTIRANNPKLPYGIVPLPKHKAQASYASFWCNGITRNAKDGDKLNASAKWIDFLASPAVQRRWTPAIGELPARTAIAAESQFADDPDLQAFIQSLSYSYADFLVNEADARQAVMDAFDNVTLKGMDAKDALSQAQDTVQGEMDDYWSSVG